MSIWDPPTKEDRAAQRAATTNYKRKRCNHRLTLHGAEDGGFLVEYSNGEHTERHLATTIEELENKIARIVSLWHGATHG